VLKPSTTEPTTRFSAQVHDRTDVAGDSDPVQRELAIRVDADFRHLREMAGVTEVEREPEPAALWQLLAPACFLGRQLEHSRGAPGVQRKLVALLQPARLAHDLEQELQVIAIRRDRALVQE
jgi:sensor domain CHASE-containing protein